MKDEWKLLSWFLLADRRAPCYYRASYWLEIFWTRILLVIITQPHPRKSVITLGLGLYHTVVFFKWVKCPNFGDFTIIHCIIIWVEYRVGYDSSSSSGIVILYYFTTDCKSVVLYYWVSSSTNYCTVLYSIPFIVGHSLILFLSCYLHKVDILIHYSTHSQFWYWLLE